MEQLPILYQPLLDLVPLGITRDCIHFQSLTLNEKYICVREQNATASNVIIIDLANPRQVEKRQIKAESAIMNPIDRTIGLKLGSTLQVFKLVHPQPVKVGSCNTTDTVEFWKWISPTMIGLVTSKAVYHWDLRTSGTEPVLLFQRLPQLNNHRIMNYHVNHDLTWMCLVGIGQEGQRFVGHMQLYSTEKNVSQPLEGHAATFAKSNTGATLFCFVSRTATDAKLFIGEVSGGSHRVSSPVNFPENAPGDFPVALEVSNKYKVLYLITKEGFFHLYDLKGGKPITVNKISPEVIFAVSPLPSSGGVLTVNQAGQVTAITVNETTIIPYIINQLKDIALALSLSLEANLRGAENLFQAHFQQLFSTGQYQEAAKVAAESPGGILRTMNTITMFKNLQVPPGTGSPLLHYFVCLLDRGSLNEYETLELVRPVLTQNRKDLIEKWLASDQLYCSEGLGDLVRSIDRNLAIIIYDKAGIKAKVVTIFAELGQYPQLVAYCKRESFQPNWIALLGAVIATNPTAAADFAKMLLTAEGGPLMDINAVIDAFMSRQLVKETTSVLLDILAANRPEDAHLQTRLLEINLKMAPLVAEAIFDNKMFTHYDRAKICQCCQAAGLTHRALQHASDFNEVKRLMVTARNLNPQYIVPFFGERTVVETLDCLRELLRTNSQQHLELVVAVGVKYTPLPTAQPDPEQLHPERMIALFEEFHSFTGIYLYLKQIVALHKTNKNIVYKFIEAAANMQPPEMQAIEMAVRDYDYEPERVRDFLKEQRLPDQLPLVLVCDKYNFVTELTNYLYKNNMMPFIEAYVQNINPINTPAVVGTLIDLNCDEEKIHGILNNVGHLCPVDTLVEEVERRNKLRMLRGWLEARVAEGNKEPATHNARAKILIISNDERREQFLLTNEYYNPLVVGKFCEGHDAHLAYVAYKRGKCSTELVDVTNRHGLFKPQARYLVEEQDASLWATVLSPHNEYRRQVIDEVVQVALPETKRADLVSSTVKAFMTAELPNELIELLEKIVLQGTEQEFRSNRNLQNLLLLTAIKADKTRVMDYINQLDAFDAPEIAEIAIDADLFEEAFVIYKKFRLNVKAIQVLIKNLKNLERAADFADACSSGPDGKEVYSNLGEAQLNEGLVEEAVDSLMKAEDPSFYDRVVEAAKKNDALESLSKYLKMCRKKIRNERVDSELAYTYAKLGRLPELDEFINSQNIARIQDVGDICFKEKLYEAARLLYTSTNNYARLASTLVKLQQFSAAVEAARKANSTQTWKEVNRACVDAGEFRFDKIAGINVILNPDELEDTCTYYEVRGHTNELIALLESGLGLERAHNGLFTELAIIYSKHRPPKLMEHLKFWRKHLYVPKLCQVCRNNRQWPEVVFLHEFDGDFDKAAKTMIEHSVDAWDDIKFKEIIAKVSHVEVLYEAIKFYLDQHPDLINDLLGVLTARLDPAKVVERVAKMNHLPLIKRWLVGVQDKNVAQVNEALNELYIEEEDYDALRHSIDGYDNFDSVALARKLEKSDLLEFRRISARLYRQNKRWKQSIDISKKDQMYKDTMDTAMQSGDPEIAEGLLEYFVQSENKKCFAACLFTCYDLLRPDYVLELAWRYNILDYAFPFLIQFVREYTSKVDGLVEASQKAAEKAEQVSVVPPPTIPYGFPPVVGGPPPMMSLAPPGFSPVVPPPSALVPVGPPSGVIPPGLAPPGMVPVGSYVPDGGFGYF